MWFENKLIFIPAGPNRWSPPPDPAFQDVYIKDSNGETIHAWWLPRPGGHGALHYSHGNAGNLSWRGQVCKQWSDELNCSVLIYDYPGFGKSTGSPDETGCYAAAHASWKWLTEQTEVSSEQIIIYGKSLGGAMAVDLARQYPHRALILSRPFTSIPDVGADLYPLFPIRWLARTKLEVLSKIGECKRPIFLFHSHLDEIIPCTHSARLDKAIQSPHECMFGDFGYHNDPHPPEFWSRIRAFLEKHAPN